MHGEQSGRVSQVKLLIQKARTSLERGEPKEAMRLFREVLLLEPNHPHVQQWVAKLQSRMKKPAGVAATAGAPAARAPKTREEALLAGLPTDVHTADRHASPSRAVPSKARPRRPAQATPLPESEFLEVEPPRPSELDGTAPLPQAELEAAQAASRAVPKRRKGPRFGQNTVVTTIHVPEEPAQTEPAATSKPDPDVASLMAGSARGSKWKRYRGLAYVGLVALGLALCILAFRSHSQTYKLQLAENSSELSIHQGAFFFAGWSEPRKISVGYDAGWQQRIGKPDVIQELRTGKVFDSGPEVDAFVVSIFTQMGDKAFAQKNPDTLLEAIYYFKQAHRLYERFQPMPREEVMVRRKLVEALLLRGTHHTERGEKAQAKDILQQALRYDPNNPEIARRLEKLEQPLPVPTPATDPAKPDSP